MSNIINKNNAQINKMLEILTNINTQINEEAASRNLNIINSTKQLRKGYQNKLVNYLTELIEKLEAQIRTNTTNTTNTTITKNRQKLLTKIVNYKEKLFTIQGKKEKEEKEAEEEKKEIIRKITELLNRIDNANAATQNKLFIEIYSLQAILQSRWQLESPNVKNLIKRIRSKHDEITNKRVAKMKEYGAIKFKQAQEKPDESHPSYSYFVIISVGIGIIALIISLSSHSQNGFIDMGHINPIIIIIIIITIYAFI